MILNYLSFLILLVREGGQSKRRVAEVSGLFWGYLAGLRGIDRLKSRYLGNRAPITLATL